MESTKTRCSDTPLRPVVVLEGTPGAGKTTAAEALAAEGHTVIGEYVTYGGDLIPVADHPDVDDDASHQDNWLLKHRHVQSRRTRPVVLDRDWLTSLAYAASLSDDTGPDLLTRRAAWAARRLRSGALAVADIYVVLDVDPDESLRRRAGRLTPGHPWSTPAGVARAARFYANPVAAIAPINAELADHLHGARWRRLFGLTIGETVTAIRDTLAPR